MLQLLTEQTISIAVSAEVAYKYTTNLERFSEWFPGVISIQSANTLEHGQPGKEYLETVAVPLKGTRQIKIRVKETQANKVFITEGDFLPLKPRMEILIHATEANICRITWRMLSRNDNFLFKATLLHLFKRVMKRRAAVGLKRLQQKLERTGCGQ